MQLSLSLMSKYLTAPPPPPTPDQYGRLPFTHPALEGLGGLHEKTRDVMIDKRNVAQLALQYGIDKLVRWKPKKACILLPRIGIVANLGLAQITRLENSGQDVVCAQALYAIIGAIALQKGGEVANRLTRERVLTPLDRLVMAR